MTLSNPPDAIDIGITGLGKRALNTRSHVDQLSKIDEANLVAACDLSEEARELGGKVIEEYTGSRPSLYASHADLVQHDGLDAVIITTPWHLHIPMSITAMRAGVDAATEVGPASTVEECRQLVEVAERTGQRCMMLENFCFNKEDMTMCHMARNGCFGEIVHASGGYTHDKRSGVATDRDWTPNEGSPLSKYVDAGDRTRVELTEGLGSHMVTGHLKRNGDLYPSHALVTMAKCLNVNRGNRITSLTSTASKSRSMADWTDRHLDDDHPNADLDWTCGDIVKTNITCANGATMSLTYDFQLPAIGGHGKGLRGTRGACDSETGEVNIDGDSTRDSFEDYYGEYVHPLWERYEERGVEPGHHGGDFVAIKSFVEAVRRDVTPPVDVYDMATIRAITPLTERSIELGSDAVDVPDFTDGQWMTNDSIFGVTGEADGVITPGDLF